VNSVNAREHREQSERYERFRTLERVNTEHYRIRFLLVGIAVAILAFSTFGQPPEPKPSPPKTILLDVDGNKLTDEEFVDLRVANRTAQDPAAKTILEDGTIQFKLSKVPQEGTDAPVFSAHMIDGKFIDAADLKGKVVVLNFWFIGCPGCMDEMPKLNELAAKYNDRDKVVFIAVATNTAQELRQFLTRNKFDYRMVGSGQSVIDQFKFSGYPRNIVIGKDGKIAYWRTVVKAWGKFDSVIQKELEK
jgi:peroxiredoxin